MTLEVIATKTKTKPKKKNKQPKGERIMNINDMALILKPSLKSPKVITKSKVDKVYVWARKEFEKAEELLLKRKSQIILETARRLEDLGMEKSKISTEISKNLKGYVDQTYVPLVLKDYPQYKDKKHSDNAKKRKSRSNIRTNPAQNEQSENTEQAQTPQPDEDERKEIYQIKLADARIEDIDRYDVPALRRLLGEALQRIQELKDEKGEKQK